jgi:hypothetical protein
MDWQEFEDKLHEKARQHEVPIDAEALWERMQRKRKRRVLPIWWWGGAIVGLGLLAVWYGSQENAWKRELSVEQMQKPMPASGEMAHANTKSMPELWQMYTVGSFVLPESNRVRTIPFYYAEQHEASNRQAFHAAQQNTRFEQNLTTRSNSSSNHADQSAKGSTGILFNTPTKLTSENSTSTNPIIWPLETKKQPFVFSQHPIPAALPQRLASDIRHLAQKVSPKPLEITPRKSKALYFGLTGTAMLWQTQRQLPNGELLGRDGERLLEAISGGFSAQAPLSGPWSLRTGIHYTQQNSIYNWSKRTTIIGIPRTIQNQLGNGTTTQTVDSSGWIVQTRTVQQTNRVSNLAIPLDIHRSFGRGPVAWSGFAGVQVQAVQRGRGIISGLDSLPNRDLYTNIYRRSIGLGLRAGVSCRVALSRHLVLSIDPVGMVDLTSRTAAGYPQERFYQYGIGLGLWYKMR